MSALSSLPNSAVALVLLQAAAAGAVHNVVNETNYHTFSSEHPVLVRIRPGDVVVTKTVDSAGFDDQGVRHTKTHGNPLTGPFYVEGAEPGDAVRVTLRRVRLNRNSGYTAYRVGALTPEAREKFAPPPYREGAVLPGRTDLVPMVIDREARVARPKDRLSSRIDLTFPAVPMLGCIGVVPGAGKAPTSGPAGFYGGNMDYKEVREGATVLLPVNIPGAFLFIGDGHALQGDGEAVGSGVETSLDVEFTVELQKNAKLTGPRLINATHLVSIGGDTAASRSLNEALATATSDMMRWLVEEHGMEPIAAHLLIGHAASYDVVALSGVMAVKIPRRYLRQ